MPTLPTIDRRFFYTGLYLLLVSNAFAQNKPLSTQTAPAGPDTLVASTPTYPGSVATNYVRTWEPMAKITDPGLVLSGSLQNVRQSTQYLDGLGRPLQTVAKGIAPQGKDLVAPIIYDAFGREAYKYLPYVQTTGTTQSDGSFKTDPFNSQKSFYQQDYKDINGQLMYPGEQVYYNETKYEPSPLNRVERTMAPGNSWAGSGKGVEQKYLINTVADGVRIWNISVETFGYNNSDDGKNIPSSLVSYSAGELYKTVTLDEHGKAVAEYKDKEGKLVLS